jgi:hypothetical protein
MTNEQFIYWLKGYMAAQIDCQIKTDIEKALASQQNDIQASADIDAVTAARINLLNSNN